MLGNFKGVGGEEMKNALAILAYLGILFILAMLNGCSTADMVPDNVGTWLFHCHVNDHIKAGMIMRYLVGL